MANIFETLGLDKTMQETIKQEVKPEEVYESKTLKAGLYNAVVDKAYVRKTDSGAKMLEIDFNVEKDGQVSTFHYSTAIQSGDAKGNKPTYTDKRTGKEMPLPGFVSMVKFLRAINSEDAETQDATIEGKDGKPMSVKAFTGISGKKLMLGIRQEENLYDGNVTIRNDVQYWLNEEGKNEEGEDLKEKVAEKLAKNPLKKLKNKPQEQSSTEAAAATASGW